MLRTLYHNIYSFWAKIANIGISSNLSFHEKKKTQILNIVLATGTPLNLIFTILNFYSGRTILAITDILLLVGGIVILVINSYQKFLLGRLILTFMGSMVFIFQAVFFRNGGEYYLLSNLVVIIIYFNERIYIVLISLFNCILFLGIKLYLANSSFVYETVPFGKILFNTSWALLITVLALLFFKKEQKDYQDEVEEKNRELEKLNATKQKLFSIIAHDLRSPIGQLKNSLDLVNREYISPDEFLQLSSKLSSQVDQLHSTLDNLLRWSLSQFQGIKASPEETFIDELIEKNATLFKQSLERKNISFNYQQTGLAAHADPDHLMLVLRNLISNAIKYSYPDSSINILSYAKTGNIIIEIKDSGMGMDNEMKNALFDSADMTSHAGTSNEKGTGLGLKLCKEFIEKNNGLIWLESAEQKGTIFYISVPASNN